MSEHHYARIATPHTPCMFRSGASLDDVTIAYKTFGTLNAQKDNAILLFHVLTNCQHVAGLDTTGPQCNYWTKDYHEGWWDALVGDHKAIDTTKYCVICANYIGGCHGSTGPSTLNPATNVPYKEQFPLLSLQDIVDSQVLLLDALGIDRVHAVIGPSVGSYMALDFAVRYPERVKKVVSVAGGLRVTTEMRVSNFEQIMAIEAFFEALPPEKRDASIAMYGLMLARMIAQKYYIVPEELESKVKRQVETQLKDFGEYTIAHPVESYFLYNARKLTQRFDPYSYLRIVQAWQTFDVGLNDESVLEDAPLTMCQQQNWLLFSINSDICFPPREQHLLAHALNASSVHNELVVIDSHKGHDSFLVEQNKYALPMRAFLETVLE